MSDADTHPILMCRLECPAEFLGPLDEWIPKHLDDSLEHPAVVSAANFAMVRDWERLPSVLNNHGNRMVNYAASDIDGCVAWLDSPEIRGAIEDGVDRESQYPLLDGEPFTGNIYEVSEVRGTYDADFVEDGAVYAERFEVPADEAAEFDRWAASYADQLAKLPGAIRVRTWRQYRDAPARFPYDRYRSKGNRMISVDFATGTDPYAVAGSPDFSSLVRDSVDRWDLVLPYVKRDLASNIIIRDPAGE